jgi:uncharacterized protein (TIGR03792 family)
MVIEWLKFKVSEENREIFVQKDQEIWTSMLNKYAGFLGKEVWLNPEIPEELVIIVYWENRELWKTIAQKEIDQTDQKFALAMSGIGYELMESLEYQVRKLPRIVKQNF